METILNLLSLSEARRAEFLSAAQGQEQLFFDNGAQPDEADYARATVILGNPPADMLRRCRRLKLLQTRSAGLNPYDQPGVLPEGAELRSASGAYGHSVSEHLFALLLALMKRLNAYRDQQRGGAWRDLRAAKSLLNARVLCVGTGDLGSSFALLCKAFGAQTAGVRRNAELAAPGIDAMYGMDALDALLPLADVVTLTLPQSPDTVRLLDRRRLLLMKPDAILLNGGRGSAVDCGALAEVLAGGHLWGAGLDVTEPEPLPSDHPLWRQERALITPHVAGGNHLPDTADRVAAIALAHLRDYLAAAQDEGK